MQPGETIDDRFEVVAHHVDGGMGTVYRGRETATGAPVAIKVVTATTDIELARFEREADLLATLEHPGIVRYIAHGMADGDRRYLIQEWIDGQTLHELLFSVGVTRAEAVDILQQMAAALSQAHSLGIVHRDIKPSNVMVETGPTRRVRLLDFGLARLTEASTRVTRTGTTVGTPGYMSPEQVRFTKDVTPRADVFAMGCVLYRCLSGHHPFAGRNPAAVRTKVLVCEPPPLSQLIPDIPAALNNLVNAMLAKDPADRPASASEVAERLASLKDEVALPSERVISGDTEELTAPMPSSTSSGTHTAIVMMRDLSRDELLATDAETEALQAKLSSALSAFRGNLEVLDIATIVFQVGGDEKSCADRALRAALVLSALGPSAGVAITVGESQNLSAIIERASRCAEAAGVKQLFGADDAGAVYLDNDTAHLLPRRFTTETSGEFLMVRTPSEGTLR